ncbi:hypothetical protein PDESU_05681 [Pontiella desulfatans]|uniref:PEP-CTERM protein-sorting domain-containing protein n=1 Tax=Pontiella desulfatans TaxID=2750659 RepID=A0A6C2UCY5_PONDE|nr:hypothetical protein [Pontiella desulfatans]VGO17086.1 hypothetical protein PDESU_05681 [Pontiella desulfatans]
MNGNAWRIGIAVVCVAGGAFADLVEYDFSSGLQPSSSGGGVVASPLVLNGACSVTITNVPVGSASPYADSGLVGHCDFKAGSYIQLSITPQADYSFDLESLSFKVAGIGGNRSYRVEYSFDGFTTPGILVAGASIPAKTGEGFSFLEVDAPLADQDASANRTTDTVFFRFYGQGSSWGPVDYLADNITVLGTVVPEPAVVSLLGFFGGGMVFVHRFNRRRRERAGLE